MCWDVSGYKVSTCKTFCHLIYSRDTVYVNHGLLTLHEGVSGSWNCQYVPVHWWNPVTRYSSPLQTAKVLRSICIPIFNWNNRRRRHRYCRLDTSLSFRLGGSRTQGLTIALSFTGKSFGCDLYVVPSLCDCKQRCRIWSDGLVGTFTLRDQR